MLGDKFDQTYPHLASLRALWETKWSFPCKLGVYPFHDGKLEDFQPIFEKLIADNINDAYSDKYTEYFLPTAERLTAEADELAKKSDDEDSRGRAIELYLRACCVLRISRFPSVDAGDGLKREVYNRQKEIYLRGARLWKEPMREVMVPHSAAANSDGRKVPIFVRYPSGGTRVGEAEKRPVVLLITGLDGHRPDNTGRSDEFTKRGWASVIVEPPGTADCPSSRKDPKSPDRLFESVLNWIKAQPQLDETRVVAWGLSAGGYYAIRVAHTHCERLVGAIGQGAGVHHFLSRDWLEKVDGHEYPFKLSAAYVEKYGYKDWEEMLEKAQADFSLVEDGTLKIKCCRLLLVNGTMDGLMPVEDTYLCLEHGRPKEARLYTGMLHMGYPPANECVWPWMEDVMASGP